MDENTDVQPKWQPLPRVERRVAGVLVEKAKTTPSGYPMSLNGIATACNQKSNRDPVMNLSTDDVEDALDKLRQKGAVAEVHGDGRVIKYRHYMKDWLAVDGAELAVMTELMLRGAQTVGELRGRAARMAPIADLSALRPILRSLVDKGLLIELTPEGRGQVVTHALCSEREVDEQRKRHGSGATVSTPSRPPVESQPVAVQPAAVPVASNDSVDQLRGEVNELREEVAKLRKDLEDLWSNLR